MPDKDRFRTTELDPELLSRPFGVQTNWHVIAGAQSSGKTTLINQLADQGFRTAPEGARLYLEAQRAKGHTYEMLRRNMPALQRGIADTQLTIEAVLSPAEVVCLDRAIPDCLAWWRLNGLDPNELLPKCFCYRYATVFILDRLPVHDDGLRPEGEAVADFIAEWTIRDYHALGYHTVSVPALPPEERLGYVLDKVVTSR